MTTSSPRLSRWEDAVLGIHAFPLPKHVSGSLGDPVQIITSRNLQCDKIWARSGSGWGKRPSRNTFWKHHGLPRIKLKGMLEVANGRLLPTCILPLFHKKGVGWAQSCPATAYGRLPLWSQVCPHNQCRQWVCRDMCNFWIVFTLKTSCLPRTRSLLFLKTNTEVTVTPFYPTHWGNLGSWMTLCNTDARPARAGWTIPGKKRMLPSYLSLHIWRSLGNSSLA